MKPKTKLFLIISSVVIFILIIILLIYKPSAPPTTTPSPIPAAGSDVDLPDYTLPPLDENNRVDYSSSQVQTAVKLRQKLLPYLPIYIENFSTSVNISTTINVFTIPDDLEYLIHIDIYGPDYQNSSTDESINPNLTAFKESFQEIIRQMEKINLDISQIYFVFGGPEYIQKTAEIWLKSLNLF